jgi:hypothetical protein
LEHNKIHNADPYGLHEAGQYLRQHAPFALSVGLTVAALAYVSERIIGWLN